MYPLQCRQCFITWKDVPTFHTYNQLNAPFFVLSFSFRDVEIGRSEWIKGGLCQMQSNWGANIKRNNIAVSKSVFFGGGVVTYFGTFGRSRMCFVISQSTYRSKPKGALDSQCPSASLSLLLVYACLH